ncbi:MAG: RNA polymerase sigma factor [Phenylobacterium sp.]|uniref:RNA polymerase sigma factor n=1 Tax=Phenylobacterium sp. TaxID=1871053 RepID=UPI0027222B3C|nr:RNA polymerase sigma factor [Phenylobacterium sp.]MDO8912607.1 RNA polymerase sigma factor [Phenylobacterium sp.]MDP3101664.1 RNA polymerase sigma factor [Phenylobacterium sp.]
MKEDVDLDADLVARARDGDDQAFGELLRRYKPAIFGFVRRYVGDADVAVDVVQETFIAAWLALARYDGRRPLRVWLRAIALNKCRDRGRRLAVRRFILGDKDDLSPEAQAQPDPAPLGEAQLISAERRAIIQKAIETLPAKLKEPLLLTYFDELTQEEAADLLGVTVKAIETRVYRARQRLAELLDRTAI